MLTVRETSRTWALLREACLGVGTPLAEARPCPALSQGPPVGSGAVLLACLTRPESEYLHPVLENLKAETPSLGRSRSEGKACPFGVALWIH